MRFGVFASLLFHLAILGAAFVSLPSSWRPDVEAEPYIPLELIAEAELDLTTSVPAAAPEPVVEEEPEPELPEPIIEEVPAPEPEPVAAEPEPEPEPEPVVVAAEPETPEPTPPKKQPTVKPQRTAELDLDALSKLVDKSRDDSAATAREAPSQTAEAADRPRRAAGAGDRLTASDEAKVQTAVNRCWNVGTIIGAPDPKKLIVTIDIALNRDGTLASPPKVVNQLQINLSRNRFWKVAEREAISAILECAPYDFLPQDRYEAWKEFTFNFIPPV
jgi:hypothetical protein